MPLRHEDADGLITRLNAAIDLLHVDLHQQTAAIDRIDACIDRGRMTPSALIALQGNRVGKSRIADLLAGKIGKTTVRPLDRPPCLITCPPGANAESLVELFGKALKTPVQGRNLARSAERICDQLSKFDLLIVDHPQRCADVLQTDGGVLELLGTILASGAVPMLLTGKPMIGKLPSVFHVADLLDELVGRQYEPMELPVLTFDAAGFEANRDFLGIVGHDLQEVLNSSGMLISLHDEDLVARFLAATRGIVSYQIDLIHEALRSEIRSRFDGNDFKKRPLRMETLAEAWRRLLAHRKFLSFNPFARREPPSLAEVKAAFERPIGPESLPQQVTAPGSRAWA